MFCSFKRSIRVIMPYRLSSKNKFYFLPFIYFGSYNSTLEICSSKIILNLCPEIDCKICPCKIILHSKLNLFNIFFCRLLLILIEILFRKKFVPADLHLLLHPLTLRRWSSLKSETIFSSTCDHKKSKE